MPTISVCIVTYNSAADIAQCLEAVGWQSMPIASVVIVDNASGDNTVETIKSYRSESVSVTLIENRLNNGFAGGQNQAIGATDSDYVLVLNPDVRLQPDYVAQLVEALEHDKEAGSATGQLVFAHDTGIIDSTGLAMGFLRQAKDRGAGEPADNWNEAGDVFGVSGAASLYARRMIRDIAIDGEFFDEQFFAYKEDVDVAWRALRLGWKAKYVPAAKALHARGWKKGARSAVPLFIRQHSYMNRFYTLIKNEEPGWHLLLRLPAIAAVEALKLGYIILREPALLKCWPTLIRHVPLMFRKRAAIRRLARRKTKARINQGGHF